MVTGLILELFRELLATIRELEQTIWQFARILLRIATGDFFAINLIPGAIQDIVNSVLNLPLSTIVGRAFRNFAIRWASQPDPVFKNRVVRADQVFSLVIQILGTAAYDASTFLSTENSEIQLVDRIKSWRGIRYRIMDMIEKSHLNWLQKLIRKLSKMTLLRWTAVIWDLFTGIVRGVGVILLLILVISFISRFQTALEGLLLSQSRKRLRETVTISRRIGGVKP